MPIQYSPGFGIKTEEEFMALWTLFYVTNFKNICKLQIMGDSKLVIDWLDRKVFIEALCLEHILWNIRSEINKMKWFSAKHILRELSSKADWISKEAL